MTYPTHEDRVHLAELVVAVRPKWERWLVLSILQSHSHNVTLVDMTIAAMRIANDPTIDTPKAIGWKNKHYRDLDTAPAIVTKHRERCDVCGKPEERCLTERPGPDDHDYTPTSAKLVHR